MDALINWLRDATRYEIQGRGTVYAGQTPFAFDKSNAADMESLKGRPWVISHPDAEGKLWRCVGLESYALERIAKGSNIGILVREWDSEKEG